MLLYTDYAEGGRRCDDARGRERAGSGTPVRMWRAIPDGLGAPDTSTDMCGSERRDGADPGGGRSLGGRRANGRTRSPLQPLLESQMDL